MNSFRAKLARAAVGLGLVAFMPLASAQAPAALSPDLQEIATMGQLVIGVREAAVPFAFVDANGPRGYSVDVCARIGENVRKALNRPDLRIRYNPLVVTQRALLVREKVIDLECSNTSVTEARERDFDFSIPYAVEQAYLVSLESAPFDSLAQVPASARILVTGDSTTEDRLARQGLRDRLQPMRNAGRALFALKDGVAPAYAGSIDVFLGAVLQRGGKASDFHRVPMSDAAVEPLAVMMREGRPGLKQIADDTIRQMVASGELAALYTKWFERPIFPGGQAMNLPMSAQWRATVFARQDQ